MTSLRPRLAAFLLLLAACTSSPAPSAPATQPLTGVPGSGDSADRQCHVVLRQAARLPNGRGGFQTSESGDWIWGGSLDVSAAAAAEGALPAVQYHYGSDPTWWEVYAEALESEPGPDGFVRYRFRLEDHLPDPGMSATGIARARVDLIPVLHLASGARAFDHNRRPGDFDTYALVLANGFSIADDPAACPAGSAPQPAPPPPPPPVEATLDFDAAWNESQDRAIVAGGQLTVDYALERLGACRGTHNGYPAWLLLAHARFLPGGQHVQASLRAFETVNGFPTTIAYPIPARFDVPADATRVELWFENSGLWCQAWDSSFGQNYGFDVLPPA